MLLSLLLLMASALVVRPQGQPPQTGQQSPVKLDVLVLDGKNRLVTDLRQEDFQIFEGDVPQTISSFSKEEAPVSYGLLIDGSGSLRTQLNSVLSAGRTMIEANKATDETFILRFIGTNQVYMEQEFTADKDMLRVKLNGLKAEGGQTAIIDAVYLGVEHLRKSRQGESTRRHALVLITDGEDRASRMKQEELVKLLRSSGVRIFVIGLVDELDKEAGLVRKSPREKAVALLEEMAKETGGHAFLARTASDLETIANEIARALHTQYVIGYSPATQPAKGKDSARKVRVKLIEAPGRGKLKAIVRPVVP